MQLSDSNRKYQGQFVDKQNAIITVTIFDLDHSTGMGDDADLSFPAEEPLVIEWNSDKTDAVIGSTATVTIISPGDRTYLDLYRVEAGRIWLTVERTRGGVTKLVWIGSLDTEFYSEPYSRLKDYDVTLTFSDFGILKRIPYDLTDRYVTIDEIVSQAINRCLPDDVSIDSRYISTYCDQGEPAYTNAQVQSSNFTDEDGEVTMWYDVLESVLKPLALRIEQRAGQVWVYDINAILAGNGAGDNVNGYVNDGEYVSPIPSQTVNWTSDDSVLSVDETYNRVKVTFSPYGEGVLFDGDKCDFEPVRQFSYRNGYGYQSNDADLYWSFKLKVAPPSTVVPGIADLNGHYLFKTEPIEDGSEAKGVIVFWGGANYDSPSVQDSNWPYYNNADFTRAIGTRPTAPASAMGGNVIYRTKRFALPNGDVSYLMRIKVPMMIDGRFNPFAETNGDHNQLHANFGKYANAVYLRVDVKLYDSPAADSPSRWYQNWPFTIRSLETARSKVWNEPSAGWKTGSQSTPSLMEWCKMDGNKVDGEACATLGGLQDNHEAYNFNNKANKIFSDMMGMHVPVSGGWAEIVVYDTLFIYDKHGTFTYNNLVSGVEENIYKLINRWLIGFPTVELVKFDNEKFDTFDVDDIEESGTINAAAKDELSIDTICGTTTEPAARGAYLKAGSNIAAMIRHGRRASAEQLLIGTIYSQYANRHLKLEGTARPQTPYGGISVFTDSNMPNTTLFMLTSETLNVIDYESEITMVEASVDNYSSE